MSEDHDLLLEIRADLKHLVGNFKNHVDQDSQAFQSQNKRIADLEKAYWKGLGILSVLSVLSMIVIKYWSTN